jgi:outer membrane protein OmpA-like peptidoglycan-associated protein
MKFYRFRPFVDCFKVHHGVFPVKWIVLLLFLGMAENTLAQTDRRILRWFQGAEQSYKAGDYEQAIDYSKRILERDSTFINATLLLADIYNQTGNTPLEIANLKKAAGLSDSPLIYYRLGEAHYSTGNYQNALLAYEKYLSLAKPETERANEVARKAKNCRFSIHAMANPVDFHPERLPGEVNSAFDEYWPSLSIDGRKLVITRLMDLPGQLPQEDFYISVFGPEGWVKAEPMTGLNTPENEGAQSLSADGTILFFTACNSASGMGSCDIYYSYRLNDRWSSPVNAGPPLNSQNWEAQPSISSDGRTLYFTSNRPGGIGMKDIWKTEITGISESGMLEWSEPVNLGDSINTAGNETSPFIHASNKSFYFASDYHTGMGGFDLFKAEIQNDTSFSAPQNLGFPINTMNNEQGLFVSTAGESAFFASERAETGLDIFSFQLAESIRPVPATYVRAAVVDALTGEPVQARIVLTNLTESGQNPRAEITDKSGEVLLSLPGGANYAFSVSKEGYLFYSDAFELSEHHRIYNPYNLTIELKPVQVGAEMDLHNIYFETDSFRILPQSEPELQKLTDFLETNPDLKVEIQGHTDNTGITATNQKLSEMRAQSVADYLVEQGIEISRLSVAGFGEDRPVASNDTKAGRRLNRRTTIKILGQ